MYLKVKHCQNDKFIEIQIFYDEKIFEKEIIKEIIEIYEKVIIEISNENET